MMFSILQSNLVNPFEPMADPVQQELKEIIDRALATINPDAILCDPDQMIIATITAQEDCILSGAPWVDEVLRKVHLTGKIEWHAFEGATLLAEDKVCSIYGKVKEVLEKEKIFIDFLGSLSSVSTQVSAHTKLVSDSAALLYYNNLNIPPELSLSQQYAVRVGGGYAYNISDDHECLISRHQIQLAGDVSVLIQQACICYPIDAIKIEVSSLQELAQVIELGIKQVKLCGFTLEQITKALELLKEPMITEVYVGNDLGNIKQIAQIGITKIIIDGFGKDLPIIGYSFSYIDA